MVCLALSIVFVLSSDFCESLRAGFLNSPIDFDAKLDKVLCV